MGPTKTDRNLSAKVTPIFFGSVNFKFRYTTSGDTRVGLQVHEVHGRSAPPYGRVRTLRAPLATVCRYLKSEGHTTRPAATTYPRRRTESIARVYWHAVGRKIQSDEARCPPQCVRSPHRARIRTQVPSTKTTWRTRVPSQKDLVCLRFRPV